LRHFRRQLGDKNERRPYISSVDVGKRVEARFCRGSERENAGIIHEDIDVSGNIEGASRQVSRRFGIVQVRFQEVGLPAAGPDCGNDRITAGYIAPGDQYAGSTTSQRDRSRLPDAARRPGDKGGFANEVLISRTHASLPLDWSG
jgi:hypothetical protein